MKTNVNRKPPLEAATVAELVSRRHTPVFFEHDRIGVVLPVLQSAPFHAAGVCDTDGRFSGLLTQERILTHVYARSALPDVQDGDFKVYVGAMTAAQAMIRHPETLDDDTPQDEALAFMQDRGYEVVPIVSRYDDARLIGLLGLEDVSAHLNAPCDIRKRPRTGLFHAIADACRAGYLGVEA